MEDVLGLLFRYILSFFRMAVQQLIIEGIIYGLGYFSLKVITFGKYPEKPLNQKAKNHVLFAGIITLLGLFTMLMFV